MEGNFPNNEALFYKLLIIDFEHVLFIDSTDQYGNNGCAFYLLRLNLPELKCTVLSVKYTKAIYWHAIVDQKSPQRRFILCFNDQTWRVKILNDELEIESKTGIEFVYTHWESLKYEGKRN